MKLPRIASFKRPARTVTDLLDLVGLGCLDGAAWWWEPAVGLAVAGAMLILVGWAVDR